MTTAVEHILIIGAGQAGLQASETLRGAGFQGAITICGAEPHLPYHRPPLSKGWLTGEIAERQINIRDQAVFGRKGISVELDCAVSEIDPASRTAKLRDGRSISWTGLLLATGARPRILGPMQQGAAVHVLRSRDDATAIAARLGDCQRERQALVIIGGGFIGLELAASARKLGVPVVVVVGAAKRLLQRAISPEISEWFAELHRANGVTLLIDAMVAAMQPLGGGLTRIQLSDGQTLTAGLVVAGIGVHANDDLAANAGIACNNGVIVDRCGRTSVKGIVAAGDCAALRLDDGSTIRLESVHNAIGQAKAAALSLLGIEEPFRETPWFWSDQYDVRLQIAGLIAGSDASILRGSLRARSFSVFHFRAKRLLAVHSINATKDHLLSRQLLDAGISPTFDQAGDLSFNLASLKPG